MNFVKFLFEILNKEINFYCRSQIKKVLIQIKNIIINCIEN